MSHRSKMLLAARRLRQNLSVDTGVEGPYQWGTIASISTGAPSTVGVYLDSSSSVSGAVITTGIPYLSTYSPTVGDVVLIARMSGAARTQRVVVGDLSTHGVVGLGPFAVNLVSGNIVSDYHFYDVFHTALGSSATGTLKIMLPVAAYKSQTMLHIVIKGFDYSNNRGPWQVIVGGYNYSDGNWYNFNARIIGRAPFNSVRLAQDGTRNCILLGTTSTVWTDSSVEVSDVITDWNSTDPSFWGSGWASSVLASETGITNIFPCVLDQYTDGSTGGTMVTYDGLGGFSAAKSSTIPVKFSEVELAATAATITFSSIPAGFRNLVSRSIEGNSGTAASGVFDSIRFNGDTGTNYDYWGAQVFGAGPGLTTANNGFAGTAMNIGSSEETWRAGMACPNELRVANYSGTTLHKYAKCEQVHEDAAAAANIFYGLHYGCWKSTAAISSITFICGGGLSYSVGSFFEIILEP